eukprot:Gb_13384 [translate_table: standard]
MSSIEVNGNGIPSEAYSELHKIADVKKRILKPLKGSMTNKVYECIGIGRKAKLQRRCLFVYMGTKVVGSIPNGCVKKFQLNKLQEEISKLRNALSKPGEQVVFYHNDLQYGNIMIDETRQQHYTY